jgi:K+-transporting ATPase KdpF subunit
MNLTRTKLMSVPVFVARRRKMDYIIAGLASLGLFIYLVYALLRPERF